MKKQLVIIGILALLVCVGLSGCTNNPFDSEKNKFIGTWTEGGSTTFTFFSDGTGSMMGIISMTWEIKEGKLVLTVPGESVTMPYSYSFSNNDKSLLLSGVYGTYHLTKQ